MRDVVSQSMNRGESAVFYFSLRSPYSWLALHDLGTRYPDMLAQLELRPFWEPDVENGARLAESGHAFHYVPMSKGKHLYILSDVKRLAEKRGLHIVWPLDRSPHWEIPHLAWFVAQQHGRGLEYVEMVSRFRWEQGKDICSAAVLQEVASMLSLEGTGMANAWEQPEIKSMGLEALTRCVLDGVFGVPFFRIGRHRYWGIDRLEDFAAHAGWRAPDGQNRHHGHSGQRQQIGLISHPEGIAGHAASCLFDATADQSPDMTPGLACASSLIEDHAGGCG